MKISEHPIVRFPFILARLPEYLWRRKPLLIVVVLIVALVVAYLFGFRIGPGLSITRTGFLVLTNLPAGTDVYVNETFSKNAKEVGDIRIELLPGSHSVLVGSNGNYPWNEVVPILPGEEHRIRPIFVAESGFETMLKELERDRGEITIDAVKLPTRALPLKMHNGCVVVFVENNDLIAEAASSTPSCTPPAFLCSEGVCDPTRVLDPTEVLRAVIPFPGREDAVVIALGKALYALEIDPRSPQFFAPILKEHLPEVAPWTANSIVVREFSAIFTILLP